MRQALPLAFRARAARHLRIGLQGPQQFQPVAVGQDHAWLDALAMHGEPRDAGHRGGVEIRRGHRVRDGGASR